ncbi:ectonucleoside triphosphate diphosphohydrolase 1 isoform X2 [Scyliorhinus torazame]|uniref:ectonucleoside triphosphate diphosphohydrolase 1 isoform X2 n=1 Tax=Scyliorhinus torazame TaxID=75743 RepID=UPI003B58EB5D
MRRESGNCIESHTCAVTVTRSVKEKYQRRRRLLILIIIFVVLVVIILVTIGLVQKLVLTKTLKYGIVIDAGSSHTSLYIYQWPAEKMNDTGLVTELTSCKVKGPGISSYWMDVKKAGLSLKHCLRYAKEQLPDKQHHETPVYLGATAGMRLLRSQNQNLSQDILTSVEEFIKTFPFNFRGARIISGKDEGAFGWITINYLMGNFLQDQDGGNRPTVGALDLGGASTQITFIPDGKIESVASSLHFRLYGKSYNMYTHSYLCYGKDQALKMLLGQLNVTNDGSMWNPCFNSGYSQVINLTTFFNTPCTSGPQTTTHQTVTLNGTGDSAQCSNYVKTIFNDSPCDWSSCSFDGIYQPPVQGKFAAFSAFYFVMNFLNVTEESDFDKVKKSVDSFCSRPWSEVRSSFSIEEQYLSEYCFAGHYVLSLLHRGYNFTSNNWNSIKFMRKINGNNAGWTLGYMLNLTNMIPVELPYTRPFTYTSYLTVMVIFSLLLLILLSVGCLIYKKKLCSVENKI